MDMETTKLVNGVLHTRETVVVEHGGLVYEQCHKLRARAKSLGHDLEDIAQVGFIGLTNAFDRFDSEREMRFSTFATPQIWGEIQKFLIASNRGIYYPRHLKEIAYKIRILGLEALTVKEIAEKIDETTSMTKHALEYLNIGKPAHLDQEVEEVDKEFGSLIGREDDTTSMYVEEFIATLTDREKAVVANLMDGRSARAMAVDIGFSAHHVRKIRRGLEKKYLEYSM